jgi:hypothetical protein
VSEYCVHPCFMLLCLTVINCFRFGHSVVVTQEAKIVAWICVFLLNVFFITFSILRTVDRDFSWQRGFILACLLRKPHQYLYKLFRWCVVC